MCFRTWTDTAERNMDVMVCGTYVLHCCAAEEFFSAGKWHWVKIFALMVKGQAVMKMGTIGSPETSAINHQPILRNVTEELKPHFRRGGSQKSWHCVDGQVSVFRRNAVHSSSPWRWPHCRSSKQENYWPTNSVTFQKKWVFSCHNSGIQ